MTSLPVEEPPNLTDVKLRIKYYITTVVLNILLISILLKKSYAMLSSGCVFWDTLHFASNEANQSAIIVKE